VPEIPPEILKAWHQQWRHAGAAAVAEELSKPPEFRSSSLLRDPDPYWNSFKADVAQVWLDQHDKELDQQAAKAEADRRWAWWHSWINTAIAVGGFVLAIIALWRGQ
jgi:hypothetical protein